MFMTSTIASAPCASDLSRAMRVDAHSIAEHKTYVSFDALGPEEPPCYRVMRAEGRSPFVLTCDHAGRRLPTSLGSLGLSERELTTHIAWDLGIAGLGEKLAATLDAFAIFQTYSRLVIDVNRPLNSPESIVTRSERSDIPGNMQLSSTEAEARAQAIFWPYHRRIARELDRRLAAGQPSVLVTLHSFTPIFMDVPRAVQIGVLYGRDARLGHALLAQLRRVEARGPAREHEVEAREPARERPSGELCVADNEPYAVSDDGDYTLLVHGEQRGLLHVELEIRQDLLANEHDQHAMSARLARALNEAAQSLFPA
jgi:predicted N-formylglutamate amidohydrolase